MANLHSPENLSFFTECQYSSKDDIIARVVLYHKTCNKEFKLVQSDKRRYLCKCPIEGCDFRLNFNFKDNNFRAPTLFKPHSCATSINVSATTRMGIPRYVSVIEDVQSWVRVEKENATPLGFVELVQLGAHQVGH